MLVGDVFRRGFAARDAGIVDQDVDAAMTGHKFVFATSVISGGVR